MSSCFLKPRYVLSKEYILNPIYYYNITIYVTIIKSVHRILYSTDRISLVFIYFTVNLRNKSWKPKCVGSFNMDWRILVFYPEPETIHSGFHDLFRF